MRKPSSPLRSIFIFIVVATMAASVQLPTTSASVCQVRVNGVDYPSNIQPSQSFVLITNLTLTCNPVNQNVLARVDVTSVETGKIVSTNGTAIGVVQVQTAPYVKIVNVTVSNALQAPQTSGNWSLQLNVWVFAGTSVEATATKTITIRVGPLTQTASATNSSASIQSTNTTTSISGSTFGLGSAGIVLPLLVIAIMASVAIYLARRKRGARVESEAVPRSAEPVPVEATDAAVASEGILSTGYPDLDTLLGGGLPTDRAILLVSGPWDEKELLLDKIIESGLTTGYSVYFLSKELGRSKDLGRKHAQNFYVLTPLADSIRIEGGNVIKMSDVQNLSDINISFSKAMESISTNAKGKIIILDFLSDILLEHGGLTTRKWLSDFIARRKSEGLMFLASLNPMILQDQASQQVIDLFDGVIEVFEKQISGRARRFLIIDKMYGRKYVESELMLDKAKLF